MLVRDYFDRAAPEPAASVDVRLPRRLKPDHGGARSQLLRRLAANPRFQLGASAGRLAAAGRPFRLDVRQRVIVKALVSRHGGRARGAALGRHIGYLCRSGAGQAGERGVFFDGERDGIDPRVESAGWTGDRHHFRFIISPEHGDRMGDLKAYVREVMAEARADLGEPKLIWMAVCHYDTDQPHAHVLVRGRRADGRDLVMPRAYVAFGLRARAQEAAQARLGDLSRHEAERRVWRETEADRFTGFDRRLLREADALGLVYDAGGQTGAWAALMRGRLSHLERLGLAERRGRGFRLAPDLEARLKGLQVSHDVIRTLNQRRLDGAREARVFDREAVRGQVTAAGVHDELGASPFVVVRDAAGVEHYARLRTGAELPAIGSEAGIVRTARGVLLAGPAGPDRSLGL